ncbi:MAG: arylamine N-acetyltransferase, partial [Kitasatospora sp.]|nr:arylamine N-acetyltransferase [Kitasatospora sp.]
VLEEDALFDKVVNARRGGFCYELNGGFAVLLRALGYGVELLAGRVFVDETRVGPPYDHLALRVTAADDPGPWLADVGFGKHSEHPLRYDERATQQDPGGTFHITEAPTPTPGLLPGPDLDIHRDGTPEYRLEQRPRELADFKATCWYQQSSPESHFATSMTCSRLTADGGRVTLSGARLIETTAAGERTESTLGSEKEILAAYREHFGMELPRVPALKKLPEV